MLQNALATSAVLIVIISIFGSVSSDFNPVVTLGSWLLGDRYGREVPGVILVQMVGGVVGTIILI